jgi:serine/threonine protein kinase
VQTSDLPPGTLLGAYRIERRLGEGGMGVVYLAEHLRLSRMVALKVLGGRLAEDREFRTRFERESRLAASLDHPNIVPVYDAGEAEGLLYIAMRLVEGTDLGNVLGEEGALHPERALSIVSQTADALDEAHAAGLVHRDVKPGNIMLAPSRRGPQEHVFLTDFGLARVAAGTRLTKSGYFLGTIHYSSPEQFTGGEVDGRTDVYSLGCVAFECLTGVVPFERDHEPAVMYAHLQEDPPRVTSRRPELPVAVDDVIAMAMAKRPEERFATCGQMIEALRAAVAGTPVFLSPLPPGERVTTPARPAAVETGERPAAAAVTETVTPPEPRPTVPRRSRWPWIAAAVLGAAVLLAGGGWFLAAGREQPQERGAGAESPASPSSPSPEASPSPSPQPPEVAAGRWLGETRQGEEITFVVRRARVRNVLFSVDFTGCFSSEGLGELIGHEFNWGPLDEGIDPDGRFEFREQTVEGTQVLEGRFTDPQTATGTISVRTTEGVTRPCVTGKVPWTAGPTG